MKWPSGKDSLRNIVSKPSGTRCSRMGPIHMMFMKKLRAFCRQIFLCFESRENQGSTCKSLYKIPLLSPKGIL